MSARLPSRPRLNPSRSSSAHAWLLALLLSCTSATSYGATARLAIIIDDIGYNKSLSDRAARLPGDFTLAVLPFTPYGISAAHLAHNHHKELMLHAPMSNLQNLPLGQGGLSSNMSQEAFMLVLRKDLNSLPYIKGVNNHMGSRLTQETQPMAWLMTELKSRGLYFVDSRTSALTVALETAQAHKIPSRKRDVFLDDDPSSAAVARQLNTALAVAKRQGSAIAIGHPYPTTLALLENIQPLLQQHNIRLVFVSQLVDVGSSILAEDTTGNPPPTARPLASCGAPPLGLWFRPGPIFKLTDITSTILRDTLAIE